MNNSVALFDLGAELARIHRMSPAGHVKVVPVLTDDLAKTLPVLAALSATTEGVLLDTSDVALLEPVPGTSDPVRRMAVTTGLRATTDQGRFVKVLEMGDGLLDAVFDNPPSGSAPSPGERTVLAVARAALHASLDLRELGIIVYRDALIDLEFRRPVWELGTRQLASMANQSLRTLIVVSESPIDVALHCTTKFGFRFAVEADRLLRRQGEDDLKASAARIAREPDPLVLFLGAGFSASSRLPMGNALRDSAIQRLLDIPASEAESSHSLATRFHDWISAKTGWLTTVEEQMSKHQYVRGLTLEQVVRAEQRLYSNLPTLAEFRERHDAVIDAPGAAVRELATILEKHRNRIVIATVNFDQLVERHCGSQFEKFVSDEEFASAPEYLTRFLAGSEDRVPLLKFHGSIERPDTCVVSAEQTELGVSAPKLATIRALLNQDAPRTWVYVGASMRDHDLLRAFNGNDFIAGTEETWVAPFLADTVEEYGRGRQLHWLRRGLRTVGDRVITQTADAFFSALRAAWETNS